MAYEFKNLSDVDQLDQLSGSTTIMGFDNGKPVQFSTDKVGSAWNNLTNKPFDENNIIKPEALPKGYPYRADGINLQWDGNKEGRDVCCFKEHAEIYLYKVSDKFFTAAELNGATVVGSEREEAIELRQASEDWTKYIGVPCTLLCVGGINSASNPAVISVAEPVTIDDGESKFIVPSAGTYLADMSDPEWFGYWEGETERIPVGYIKSVAINGAVHPIDEDLLPFLHVLFIEDDEGNVSCNCSSFDVTNAFAKSLPIMASVQRSDTADNWYCQVMLRDVQSASDGAYSFATMSLDGTYFVRGTEAWFESGGK